MPNKRQIPRNNSSKRRLKFYEVLAMLVFIVLSCFLVFVITAGLSTSANRPNSAQAYTVQTQIAINATPTLASGKPEGEGNSPINAEGVLTPPNADRTPQPENENNPIAEVTQPPDNSQKPKGQVNILLLGSDARPNEGGFRTDIIVWVSLNPEDGYVSAISFPRDLYVSIPGIGYNRINTAFIYGGFDLLADTFEVNFGIRPDHYVMVDFNGFKTVIDDLGGIDVQAAQNLSDSCATWIKANGWCSVGPGLVHMDGEVALWYARSRYSTSDIDRARRSQEVIKAIFERLMKLDVVLKAPELFKAYRNYVDTDIDITDVVSLLPFASQIYETGDIRSYVIGYDVVYDWITPAGAQVLMPDFGLIQNILAEALGNY